MKKFKRIPKKTELINHGPYSLKMERVINFKLGVDSELVGFGPTVFLPDVSSTIPANIIKGCDAMR